MLNQLFLMFLFFKNVSSCNINLQTNPEVNLTEYIKHTWYIQQQQITGYQSQDSLYCVTATYNIDNYSHVPFFKKKVLSVYNYANYKQINNEVNVNSKPLCARIINESEPEKLYVSPCFLPNLFSGPYWIIEAGPTPDNYQWAIVGGGEPTINTKNNTCAYKLTGFKNSGLWLFSRKQIMDNQQIDFLRTVITKNNISTDNLINVTQKGCLYKNAFIK